MVAETPTAPRPTFSACETACTHCGLPVPAGLVRAGAERQFCCRACRTAYDLIHGCGLDVYYRLRESADDPPRPARSTGRGYEHLDDPVAHRLYVAATPEGLCRTELYLENLHCAACVWLVEKLPAVVPGVLEARLDFRRGIARITWEPERVPLSAIARALDALGYPPHPAKDVGTRAARRREDRRSLVRLAVAGAAAGNVMLLAFALYGGAFAGMAPEHAAVFRWLSAGIGVLALAWPGAVFFRGAWASLRTRTPHLDLPIAIGLGAGGLWGALNVVRGAGEIYFDSLTVLVFALLVGRWIQQRQQRWAADELELLFSLTPGSARRVEAGGVREVPIEALAPGDLVEVRAGDSVPVDGRVESGRSRVDASLLSGESRPVGVGPPERVSAGTVNLSASLRVRVEATGEATRVGRLMRMVAEGAARRAPLVRIADRLAGWFVAVVMTLAAGTLLFWSARGDAGAMDHAVALLIVACPCAVGLATPLAITVAIGRAAKRRILIKGGDALERLARPGTILLDKTGTLTLGRTRLVRWTGPEEAKALAAALEAHSAHPVARAMVEAFGRAPAPADEVRQTIGAGIEGLVEGRRVALGSPAFVLPRVARLPEPLASEIDRAAAEALTPVLVAVEGEAVAVAAFGDPVREDASDAVARLAQRGWRVEILSGDHPRVVLAVGASLGLAPERCRGGVSPEGKLEAVKRARGAGPVVMVGDGVNDAAALAAADVGIAVHGGAEASLAAADVYLNRPGLLPVLSLLTAARRTVATIRLALAASLGYNALAVTLAAAGVINPIIAAVLMPASSLTVLTLAVRSRTFGSEPCPSSTS